MSDRIIWIYGNTGAGKTTLAKRIRSDNTILLDGDRMREIWKLGFTKEDRWEQNLRTARLAAYLYEQGFEVIVALICPYKKLREEVTKLINPRWILVEGGMKPSEKYPFER